MWQGKGEEPGLPLDQLRFLIQVRDGAQTAVPVRPDSPFAQPRAATMASGRPALTSSQVRRWQRDQEAAARRLQELVLEDLFRASPLEPPFLRVVSSVQQSDQERTH